MLNRVVPDSMEELVVFAKAPQGRPTEFLKKYLLFFKTTTQLVSNSSAAWGMMGYCYVFLGDLTRAEKHYRKAVKIEPGFFWFHYNLGVIYYNQGRFDEATRWLQKAINCRAEDALIFINSSKIYHELNRHASDTGYETESGMVGGYQEAHDMLAKAYFNQKKYNETIIVLENAARLQLISQAVLYYYSGLVAIELNDFDRAAGLFQRCLKEDPNRLGAYYYLGVSLQKMGASQLVSQRGWDRLPKAEGFEALGNKDPIVRIF